MRTRFRGAIAAATAMKGRLPNDPLADNLLGALTLRQGDLAAARMHFQAALAIKPDFTPAQLNLGQLLLLDKDSRGLVSTKEILPVQFSLLEDTEDG